MPHGELGESEEFLLVPLRKHFAAPSEIDRRLDTGWASLYRCLVSTPRMGYATRRLEFFFQPVRAISLGFRWTRYTTKRGVYIYIYSYVERLPPRVVGIELEARKQGLAGRGIAKGIYAVYGRRGLLTFRVGPLKN